MSDEDFGEQPEPESDEGLGAQPEAEADGQVGAQPEAEADGEAGQEPEADPLADLIRDTIYTAVGLGLLAVNRWQAARQDATTQMPDDLKDALADLAKEVPEEARTALSDVTEQLTDNMRAVLTDLIDNTPTIAACLRELSNRANCAPPKNEA